MKDFESKIKKNDSVLDIGCWSGKRVLELSKRTKKAYGVDIDPSKIKLADSGIGKNLRVGDVTKKIPFKIKFDWVILSEVLEHIEDDLKALRNISNSLKKGGKLILSTPKSIKYLEFWDPAWVRWKFGGEMHHHYSKEELFLKINQSGLKVKECYVRGNLKWVIYRWLNVFLKYLVKSKKQLNNPMEKGFCDWAILAEKVK
ncbi:MAG: class I SAM-dependent methyltransferase [Candidatus Pacearchaeota archaeon]